MNHRKHGSRGFCQLKSRGKSAKVKGMLEQLPAKKIYKDNWGTGAREGYEDLGPARPRREAQKQRGSPLLRGLGGLAIVGGIFWGAYIFFYAGGIIALQHSYGPMAVVGLGAVCSVMGKYLRV